MDKGDLMLDLAGLAADTEIVIQVRTWSDNGAGYASAYYNLASVDVDLDPDGTNSVFLVVDAN